jgi:hypothetical protein
MGSGPLRGSGDPGTLLVSIWAKDRRQTGTGLRARTDLSTAN